MEHYELDDVFGRRLRPVLRVGIKLLPRADPDPHEDLVFTFLNEGRGVARHAGFIANLTECQVVMAMGNVSDVSSINDGRPTVSCYNASGVIHPNGIYSSMGKAVLLREAKGSPLKFSIKWYAEDAAVRDEAGEVTAGLKGILLS